jgi:hypothetical protein
MQQHKHADLIHKWAEGYPIQKLEVLCCDKSVKHWEDIEPPTVPGWFEDQEYRVKPLEEMK